MKLSVKHGQKKMSKNIVQLNNSFIQNEHQRRRLPDEGKTKEESLYGLGSYFDDFMFILPTYNLVQSYNQLLQRRQQLTELKEQYQTLSDEKDKESAFAAKLKDEDYVAKYARAKYYYSKKTRSDLHNS